MKNIMLQISCATLVLFCGYIIARITGNYSLTIVITICLAVIVGTILERI